MKKKLLSVLLAVACLVTLFALPVSATENLDTVFKRSLGFLDQYYTLGAEYMIHEVCEEMYPWEEAEANDYANQPTPAAEFEAVLNKYFAPTEQDMEDIRNYPCWDWQTQTSHPFYDEATDTYDVFFIGGFGGSMPNREYLGYVPTETGYEVFYQHVTYAFLPDDEAIYQELEELGWPDEYTYNGQVYQNGPDGYCYLQSRDDYGNKYEVEYNDGIVRIISQQPYTREDLPASWNDYSYTVTDGKATITGYTGVGDAITIPRTLGGYPVTTIGDWAFYWCTSLTSVTIPDSVTMIGENAFYGCTNLTSVTIPDSVTTIGDSAFASCNLQTTVDIPDSVTTIGDSAFAYCAGLTTVDIPDSVTTIGKSAFYYCTGLTAITVAAENPNYCSVDGVLFDKDKTTLIQYPARKSVTDYTILDSVTTISDYALAFCNNLTSVTLGDSVTTIGNGAFWRCNSLTGVTIPDSVATIGNSAFDGCTTLTDVYYAGTEKQAGTIDIGNLNSGLLNATWHYNYKPTELSITTQPKTGYAKMGDKVSVSVEATGEGLTYTWYFKNEGKTAYSKSSVTSATYSTTMTATSKNRMVYCVVKDKYGNTVQTNKVTLREAASIVTQPKTPYAKLNAKASVTVKASGDGLTYTWYYKNAGKTTYAKSSVTSATYSTTMTATSKNRMVYCVVKDKYGNTVQTNKVTLREAASIVTQPKTPYAKLNAKASVTVKASGDGLTYTWYYKNAGKTAYAKSSVTSATYSTTMTSTSKNRMVYCVVKDKYGNTVQTNKVTLRQAASIVTQPKTTTVAKNKTASVTVKASGDGLTYTWYIKNAGSTKYSKSSVTKSTYAVTMTSKVNGRLVYCVVKDKYGNTVKTTTVKLKMK